MQPRIVGYWSNYHCIAFVLCAGPLILSAFIGNLIGRDFHILYRRPPANWLARGSANSGRGGIEVCEPEKSIGLRVRGSMRACMNKWQYRPCDVQWRRGDSILRAWLQCPCETWLISSFQYPGSHVCHGDMKDAARESPRVHRVKVGRCREQRSRANEV
jgi:hypothetical protein